MKRGQEEQADAAGQGKVEKQPKLKKIYEKMRDEESLGDLFFEKVRIQLLNKIYNKNYEFLGWHILWCQF